MAVMRPRADLREASLLRKFGRNRAPRSSQKGGLRTKRERRVTALSIWSWDRSCCCEIVHRRRRTRTGIGAGTADATAKPVIRTPIEAVIRKRISARGIPLTRPVAAKSAENAMNKMAERMATGRVMYTSILFNKTSTSIRGSTSLQPCLSNGFLGAVQRQLSAVCALAFGTSRFRLTLSRRHRLRADIPKREVILCLAGQLLS
jgi:hypothetical protein